jgi:hypothetical protein
MNIQQKLKPYQLSFRQLRLLPHETSNSFSNLYADSKRIQALLILPEEITAILLFLVAIHYTRNRFSSTYAVSTNEEYYFFCPLRVKLDSPLYQQVCI